MARLGIAAGRLRHAITIEQNTPSRSASGAEVPSWSTFATVRAERRDVTARERLSAGQEVAVADTVFLIRWLDGLTAQMRIVFDGETYDIVGLSRYGQAKVVWEIMARRRID